MLTSEFLEKTNKLIRHPVHGLSLSYVKNIVYLSSCRLRGEEGEKSSKPVDARSLALKVASDVRCALEGVNERADFISLRFNDKAIDAAAEAAFSVAVACAIEGHFIGDGVDAMHEISSKVLAVMGAHLALD